MHRMLAVVGRELDEIRRSRLMESSARACRRSPTAFSTSSDAAASTIERSSARVSGLRPISAISFGKASTDSTISASRNGGRSGSTSSFFRRSRTGAMRWRISSVPRTPTVAVGVISR